MSRFISTVDSGELRIHTNFSFMVKFDEDFKHRMKERMEKFSKFDKNLISLLLPPRYAF